MNESGAVIFEDELRLKVVHYDKNNRTLKTWDGKVLEATRPLNGSLASKGPYIDAQSLKRRLRWNRFLLRCSTRFRLWRWGFLRAKAFKASEEIQQYYSLQWAEGLKAYRGRA